MNAELLLENFDRLADTAGGVSSIRRLILALAVQGKLVPQDENEGSGCDLLARIKEIRAERSSGGSRRRSSVPAEVDPLSFNIPDTWVWSCISEIGDISPRYTGEEDQEASFVPMTLIPAELGVAHSHDVRVWKDIRSGYTQFADGDVGVAKITPCFENGKSTVFRGLVNGIGAGTTELHVVRPTLVNPDFILIFLKSPEFVERGIPKMTGTAGQKRLPANYFANTPFPLPPLEEQARIVETVSELMAICDQLETRRLGREETRDRLAAAVHASLEEPGPETFRENARFFINVLPELTARPDQIKQLRQTILNLAVRGKLVKHDEIEARRVKLGSVAKLQNGYAFKSEWFSTTGVRLLRNANVGHGSIKWDNEVRLPNDRTSEFDRFELHEGDVVLSLDRPFISTGTKVARITNEDLPCLLLQRVGRFQTSSDLDPDFLYLWIESDSFSAQIDPGRSNGVPHISSKQVEDALIYLPPIEAQRCIVAKFVELLLTCDQFEVTRTSVERLKMNLLQAAHSN